MSIPWLIYNDFRCRLDKIQRILSQSYKQIEKSREGTNAVQDDVCVVDMMNVSCCSEGDRSSSSRERVNSKGSSVAFRVAQRINLVLGSCSAWTGRGVGHCSVRWELLD